MMHNASYVVGIYWECAKTTEEWIIIEGLKFEELRKNQIVQTNIPAKNNQNADSDSFNTYTKHWRDDKIARTISP